MGRREKAKILLWGWDKVRAEMQQLQDDSALGKQQRCFIKGRSANPVGVSGASPLCLPIGYAFQQRDLYAGMGPREARWLQKSRLHSGRRTPDCLYTSLSTISPWRVETVFPALDFPLVVKVPVTSYTPGELMSKGVNEFPSTLCRDGGLLKKQNVVIRYIIASWNTKFNHCYFHAP